MMAIRSNHAVWMLNAVELNAVEIESSDRHWWEIVSSAYRLVSLQYQGLDSNRDLMREPLLEKFQAHSCWQSSSRWTSQLHNLQLLIEPFVCFCLLKPWLSGFDIPQLERGFSCLIATLNQFLGWSMRDNNSSKFLFSSA